MPSNLIYVVVRYCSCLTATLSLASCASKRPEFGQPDVTQNTNAEWGDDTNDFRDDTDDDPSSSSHVATVNPVGVGPVSPIPTNTSGAPSSINVNPTVPVTPTATTPVSTTAPVNPTAPVSPTTPIDPVQPVSPTSPSVSPTAVPTNSNDSGRPPNTTQTAGQTATAPTGTADCRGVTGGTASIDQCGVCDSDSSNDCTPDCSGQWGGQATLDNCQVCDADPLNDCTADCNGAPGGTALKDNCGTCDSNPSNDCVRDCKGVWGGTAKEDRCGTCDDDTANDCVQDCKGNWGGEATVDMCDTCDVDPDNDCVQDCNGLWGGTAHEDRCGVCDTNFANDCFDGESGTVETTENTRFNIGSGDIFWTINGGQKGWLYSSGTPEVTYASLTAVTDCGQVGGNGSGYEGLSSLNALTDASALTFAPATDPILFGTLTSDCYMGLLVFHQGEYYGVLEFENIEEAGVEGALGNILTINWWLGAPGVTNFSNIE